MRLQGGTVWSWLRGIVIFRVPVRRYAMAVAIPLAFVLVQLAAAAATGTADAFGDLPVALLGVVAVFVLVALAAQAVLAIVTVGVAVARPSDTADSWADPSTTPPCSSRADPRPLSTVGDGLAQSGGQGRGCSTDFSISIRSVGGLVGRSMEAATSGLHLCFFNTSQKG